MFGNLTLTNATVVNTRTGDLSDDCTIQIEAGVIRDVVPRTGVGSAPGEVYVDVKGMFVVPGYNDMHTHALQDRYPEDSLGVMLAFGITGIRQLAGSPKLLLERSQGRFRELSDVPQVLEIAGEILTHHNAANPEMAVNEIKRQATEGADFIKVIDVDSTTFFAALEEANRLKLPFLGHVPPEVDASAASRKGMRSIEHLGPAEIELISCSKREWLIRLLLKIKPRPKLDLSPEKMAEIGRLIVANPVLFRSTVDKETFIKTRRLIQSFSEQKCRMLARTFAKHDTWQCPTLIRLETMQFANEKRFMSDPELRYVPASTRSFWMQVGNRFGSLMNEDVRTTMVDLMEIELRLTKIFDEEGVRMITGSDYGGGWVIPGVSLHQEFDLLAKAGIAPLKVLQMTTLLAAGFVGREQTMGTVETGKQADLVILGANPVESASALHDIRGVVRGGRYYGTSELEGLKDRVAAHAVSV
jgi:imidazolonepropionase-like amidohydrolase